MDRTAKCAVSLSYDERRDTMKNRTEERTNEELRAVQLLKKEIIYMLDKLDERKLQRVLWYIRRIW